LGKITKLNCIVNFISILALLSGLHLIATGCVAQARQEWKISTLAPQLTIQVPAGIRIVRQSPAEDFDILLFKKETKTLLCVYLGNHPEFPARRHENAIKRDTINGLKVESIVSQEVDGNLSKEVLFRLAENDSWPRRLHCWYERKSKVDAAEADKMISTIRFLK
jgi:hypothetical protein